MKMGLNFWERECKQYHLLFNTICKLGLLSFKTRLNYKNLKGYYEWNFGPTHLVNSCFIGIKLPTQSHCSPIWHYLLYCSVCTENGQLIWKVVWEGGGCWRDLNRRNLGAPAHHALVLFESMQKGQVMSHLLLNGHCTAAALVNHCDPYRLAKQLNPKDTIYCPLLYV